MKKWIVYSVEAVLFILIILVTAYNIKNNESFLNVSASQMLTLSIALGVAFWATQYENDRRKMKEHAENNIQKLQELVTNDSFFLFVSNANKDEIKKQTSMTNRRINNYINILKQYGKNLSFSSEINYIETQFTEYKTIISDHIEDMSYLEKSETQFKRFSENIDSKCDEIILSLYK